MRAHVVVCNGHVMPLANGSPWVYQSSIDMKSSRLATADVADVFDPKGRFLFSGLFSPESQIVVRKLSGLGEGQPLDREFVWDRLAFALELRNATVKNSESFRLCNAEGDGLGGLTIDVFGGLASVQFATAAARNALGDHVVSFLKQRRFESIVETTELKHRKLVHGTSSVARYVENGVKLSVDVLGAQKTGAYLDQRENRRIVQSVVRANQSQVLDLFCYNGGFGLAAAIVGATKVVCVDSSAKAG